MFVDWDQVGIHDCKIKGKPGFCLMFLRLHPEKSVEIALTDNQYLSLIEHLEFVYNMKRDTPGLEEENE